MRVTFGERLRTARKRRGLTLEALAERIDSSKAYIWQLENKEAARPSADLMIRLCGALSIQPQELVPDDPASATVSPLETEVLFRKYGSLTGRDRQVILDLMESLAARQPHGQTKGSSE